MPILLHTFSLNVSKLALPILCFFASAFLGQLHLSTHIEKPPSLLRSSLLIMRCVCIMLKVPFGVAN